MVVVTSTIPDTSDKFPATGIDWREGLVPPRPGHVHGKTALTQQEWRRLHRRAGDFVTVVSDKDGLLASGPTTLAKATGTFRHDLEAGGAAAYGPHSRYRLSVMAAADAQASR